MTSRYHECSEQEIDFLFRVIDEGKIEFVRWAMEQGVDPNLESPKSGATLLTEAISALQPAVVELLVQYGADPNYADDEGITPLELAQKTGTPAMIECLTNAAEKAAAESEDEDDDKPEPSTEDEEAEEVDEEDDDDASEEEDDGDEEEEEEDDETEAEESEDDAADLDLSLIQVSPLSDDDYYRVMSRISKMPLDRATLLAFLKVQHCRSAEEAASLEDGAVLENFDLYRALKLFADAVANEADE